MSVSETVAVHQGRVLVGGEWIEPERSYECRSPADPTRVIGRFGTSGPAEVDAAYGAAREAALGWAQRSALERGEVLRRAAELVSERSEQLAVSLALEEGKAIRDARAEVRRGVAILRYFAAECSQAVGEVYPSANPDTMLYTTREPLGVVCAITPWNFPVAIPLWKLAPALAYGNTVVWKPAEVTPVCAVQLAEIFTQAGLPAGALNLLTGSSKAVGEPLTTHELLDGITFTGSVAVGERIRSLAAESGTKVQLELGGKNPAVVLDDADLELAVELILRGAMLSTGQRCTATSRAIVASGRMDEFAERLLARADTLTVGDPLSDDTDIGPLSSREQFDSVVGYLHVAEQEGLELLRGGPPGGPDPGYFVEPTVYLDPQRRSRLSWEEVFGPVLCLIPAGDEQEALEIANETKFGLSASVFTRDLYSALRFSRGLRAGVVHVNGETAGAEPQVPFGGMKASSSHSREQGKAAVEFFTDIKTVYVELP